MFHDLQRSMLSVKKQTSVERRLVYIAQQFTIQDRSIWGLGNILPSTNTQKAKSPTLGDPHSMFTRHPMNQSPKPTNLKGSFYSRHKKVNTTQIPHFKSRQSQSCLCQLHDDVVLPLLLWAPTVAAEDVFGIFALRLVKMGVMMGCL